MEDLAPLRLPPRFCEKIWGSRDLRPFFGVRGEHEAPIGEVWYSFEENRIGSGSFQGETLSALIDRFGSRLMGDAHRARPLRRRRAGQGEPPDDGRPYFPILTKLLFVSEKLSVQVHPDDEFAMEREGGPGKTEMWYVVSAEPGAAVALGLTEKLEGERLIEAAVTGEIERYLRWEPVKAGDVLFVPPGTLHTIGPGVTICEVQQNSDITYRFFDFGRPGPEGAPRALHVHDAAAVALTHEWQGPTAPLRVDDGEVERRLLAGCPYFAAERLQWEGELLYRPDRERCHILIFLEGGGRLGDERFKPGDGFLVPAYAKPFEAAADSPTTAILAYEPDLPKLRRAIERAGATPETVARALVE